MNARSNDDGQAPSGIARSSLVTRILTAVLFGAAVLGSIALGTLTTGIVFGVMAAFAVRELYPIVRPEGRVAADSAGVAAAFALPVAASLWGTDGVLWALAASLGLVLVWLVLSDSLSPKDASVTMFGVVYGGFSIAHFVLVRDLGGSTLIGWELTSGLSLSLVVITSVWLNDSLAYLVGSQFGRNKMAPRISPKKSWEGFAGGTIGGLLPWLAAPYLPGVNVSLPWCALIGLVVGFAVIFGDLAESRMKRSAGVKDSGTVLPGHGGFLDRLDSLVLVSLVSYWMLVWGGA